MNQQEFLQKVRRAPRLRHKDQAILDRCAGKVVLDVGCAGQDVGLGDADWLHGRLRSVARTLHGVDIDESSVGALKARGFEVYLPHDLKALGETYDVVVMADVVEHVNDPVAFLECYAAFLRSLDSVILVTTPNPFAATQSLHILASDAVSVNPEHTFWLDPLTLFQVATRAGLEIREIFWLSYYQKLGSLRFADRVLHGLASVMARLRRYYSPNFMCVIGKVREP